MRADGALTARHRIPGMRAIVALDEPPAGTDERPLSRAILVMPAFAKPHGAAPFGHLAFVGGFLRRIVNARQIRTTIGPDGLPELTIMSLADYAENTTSFFAAHDFYEVELFRQVEIFGTIAHAWSAYEARETLDPAAPPERRGINSIQLTMTAELGWRIIAMIWDNERDGVQVGAF